MAPRRNYNKIPVIDKTRLRESFNRGDFLQLAKILGINRTTAYSIVNRDQDKERGGNRQTKVDDEMKTGRSLKLYRFEMAKKIIEDQAVVIDTAKCKEWHNNAMTFIPRCIVEAEIL